MATIELDIFSGRANPRWQANADTQRRLVQLEAALSPTREAAPEPPALGYRGFVYPVGGVPRRAYAGFVQYGKMVLADPELSVEQALVAALPAEYDQLRAKVIAALATHC